MPSVSAMCVRERVRPGQAHVSVCSWQGGLPAHEGGADSPARHVVVAQLWLAGRARAVHVSRGLRGLGSTRGAAGAGEGGAGQGREWR